MQRRLVSPILFTALQNIGQVDLRAQPNGVRMLNLSPLFKRFQLLGQRPSIVARRLL